MPEELSASLQKVTINAEAKESTSQRHLEQLQQSFESYKKKTKAATSLLQEKNGAMGVIFTTWHHLPAFLRDAGYWGSSAWCVDDQAPLSDTEAAALLRRIYDAHGDFDLSGWNRNEVEQ